MHFLFLSFVIYPSTSSYPSNSNVCGLHHFSPFFSSPSSSVNHYKLQTVHVRFVVVVVVVRVCPFPIHWGWYNNVINVDSIWKIYFEAENEANPFEWSKTINSNNIQHVHDKCMYMYIELCENSMAEQNWYEKSSQCGIQLWWILLLFSNFVGLWNHFLSAATTSHPEFDGFYANCITCIITTLWIHNRNIWIVYVCMCVYVTCENECCMGLKNVTEKKTRKDERASKLARSFEALSHVLICWWHYPYGIWYELQHMRCSYNVRIIFSGIEYEVCLWAPTAARSIIIRSLIFQ